MARSPCIDVYSFDSSLILISPNYTTSEEYLLVHLNPLTIHFHEILALNFTGLNDYLKGVFHVEESSWLFSSYSSKKKSLNRYEPSD